MISLRPSGGPHGPGKLVQGGVSKDQVLGLLLGGGLGSCLGWIPPAGTQVALSGHCGCRLMTSLFAPVSHGWAQELDCWALLGAI